ncbi:D-aminoacyl-tRNA deacylase [Fuchsiella alkaliacetigena]|uniref:D-aminoacyl-tRNA deacylase n=1 Tax=Fuchsiella alkaliacetigena TaxID=957042 RepID=UPI00200A14D4|nr:D-aminoacyl-tRNA deacylase [Fuchsiella alkaliacetigena]MCK8825229.1 D-aminoacyl-tRNA deacylase [Fuchsiella alkaliacetigena]
MKAVIQRAKEAVVKVETEVIGEIEKGLVVLLGVGEDDQQQDVEYLVDKTVNLRIFANQEGKMDFSALDLDLEVLIIPQFTLYGDCSEGRRPDFNQAAGPTKAKQLYQDYVQAVQESGLEVATGRFGAMMEVELVNDGPVTIVLDS